LWAAALDDHPAQMRVDIVELDDEDVLVQQVLVPPRPLPGHTHWTEIPTDDTPVGAWHLQGSTLSTLKPGNQIAVSVIEGFLKLLDMNKPAGLSMHIFNTTHITALQNFGIEAIRRRTNKLSLFNFDFLLLPAAVDGYYFVLLLDTKRHTLHLSDSLGYQQADVCQLVMQWLKRESEWRGNVYNISGVSCCRQYSNKNKPQKDGINCGVYMLL
jgi:Ulp1 family protease